MFLETFLLEHISYTVLFQIQGKHVIENLFLLFEVTERKHVGTQGRLAREQVSTQDTWACEHIITQGMLSHEHVRHAL